MYRAADGQVTGVNATSVPGRRGRRPIVWPALVSPIWVPKPLPSEQDKDYQEPSNPSSVLWNLFERFNAALSTATVAEVQPGLHAGMRQTVVEESTRTRPLRAHTLHPIVHHFIGGPIA